MDEKFIKQYDYKTNSNLVLPTDTSLTDKRPSNEATGEVQSLAGRLSGKMGDRLPNRNAEPPKNEEEEKLRDSKRRKTGPSKLKQELQDTRNFSVAEIETGDLLYQPQTQLTEAAYGLIMNFVRKRLGLELDAYIKGAADEVISTMKTNNPDDKQTRAEIEELLSTGQEMDDVEYNNLCNLCKSITDWDSGQSKMREDTAEDEIGDVGVAVDDDDESGDEYLSEAGDSGDEEPDEKVDGDTLNLEEISKRQTTIIPKIKIPEPVRKEGYQEYYIEPKRPDPNRKFKLIKIEDLPDDQKHAFTNLKTLNIIQSEIYDRAVNSDKSILICAPTGAGKTNIAILTMLREITKHKKRDGKSFETDNLKIIYVAPIKALVQELVGSFRERLGKEPYNLKVIELTGDSQADQRQISEAQIIVCTPEKWDIVTRKSIDRLYTKLVRLVIFDEIHLLHNERGATLEALVARIKRHRQMEGNPIRVVGLSATLPNYKDVARFIAPDDRVDRTTFYFDSSYRPIPLRQQYIAMTESKKVFRMINDIVYEKVVERLKPSTAATQSTGQILIFVHSRPDTFKTADYLKCKALEKQEIGRFLSTNSVREKIDEYSGVARLNPKLKELLLFGIGVHHAGLSKEERSCVERLFREGFLTALVSTATLAWGVNLPAKTVIIKGTQVYRDGKWTDLDSLDVTQMLGRAGRPGHGKEGEGIVITQQSQVMFYMSLMNEQLPVESKLIGRLPEFINAECVVGNIESLDDAVNWLSETYLSSRMLSVLESGNDQYLSMYGIESDARTKDPDLSIHKRNLAYAAACTLENRGLIVFDRASGAIQSEELGRIASHYNCSSRTMKLFHDSIHEHTCDIELLRIFSLADEFKDIFVRKGEEVDLQDLLNRVPFPIDDKRATRGANKVNALLQVYIFKLNIEGLDLICDMHFIKENAARLARSIYELVLMKGYARLAEISLDLCRKVDKRMTVCHTPLRQFSSDLDADIINRLERKNYHIDELRALDGNKIAEILRCDREQGKKVSESIMKLPKLKMEARVKPLSKSCLKIELTVAPKFVWDSKYHGHSERFWLFVQDVNQEVLLHYEIIHLRGRNREDEDNSSVTTTFFVNYLTPTHPFYFIRLFPDRWFGCDHHLPIYIEKLSLPDESTIFTQLTDLPPRKLESLKDKRQQPFEHLYKSYMKRCQDRFKCNDSECNHSRCDESKRNNFNQIQTQAFSHLYESSENLILLASAGSGKTTCAELAIIKNIKDYNKKSKCAYIGANARSAQVMYEEWTKTFGLMDLKVELLSGNQRADAAKVDSADILIGHPETWHTLTLTRSKKYKELLNKFQLFIIDDIHLLHDDRDAVLDWLASKIVFKVRKQLEHIEKLKVGENLKEDLKPARIVALGSPMACAESLKNWLTVKDEPLLLNYQPSIRPVTLRLNIQKFYHCDYKMRLQTMLRPAYRHIITSAGNKPVLIFVSDYQSALDVCETMYDYSKGERHRFVASIDRAEKLREPELETYLHKGIGFLHSGMDHKDKSFVETAFEEARIQILVVTVTMCWSIRCRSYLTIIMDTQQHNILNSEDYELSDVIQMVGLTGRPSVDKESRCVIMCQSSKADYFERFLHEPLTAESNLPTNLISHVNYEVASGSLVTLDQIYKPYIAHTFFYKRISINPNYYGIEIPDREQKFQVFKTYFEKLVKYVAQGLEKADFITIKEAPGKPSFEANELSEISLEYYINYKTLLNYTEELKSYDQPMNHRQLIEMMSVHTDEFKRIPVRRSERHALKTLKRKYKIGSRTFDYSYKVELLIWSHYRRRPDKDEPEDVEGELQEDRQYILRMCYKLLKAVVDIAWTKVPDSFSLVKTAIELSKNLVPFSGRTEPEIKLTINDIKKDGKEITIDVEVEREDKPFSLEEFNRYRLPKSMYRDEGWFFLIHGNKNESSDNFPLFKRVKTPKQTHQSNNEKNEYKLMFELPEDVGTFDYVLTFMSDFYSTVLEAKIKL